MPNKKKATIANFNMVFRDKENNERPLLDYFDTVINALKTGEEIKLNGTNYMLMNVDVASIGDEDYAIVGYIVKNTTLEVLSELDENGNLVEIENKYPSAPFSFFSIYLKNHRMVFMQNQKGSPTLRNFAAIVYRYLYRYINKINSTQLDYNVIPIPELYVVGIPMRESVIETLKQAKKINTLTLRFYPLNGDIDFSGMFTGMTTDLRKKVGSKSGEILLRSPQDINGIAEVLEDAGGTVNPIFEITYPDKSKTTIRDYQISERMDMDIKGDSMQEELKDLTIKGKDFKAISYVSKSNKQIYDNNISKVIPFVKRKY